MGRFTASGLEAAKKITCAVMILSAIFAAYIYVCLANRSGLVGELTAAAAESKRIENLSGKSAAAEAKSGDAVIEASSGKIVSGKNYDVKLPMASTTKVVTAAIAVDSGRLDDVVTIPKEACGIEGSSIYLTEGEKMTLRDLVYGLMLRSGNDAATAIALYLGGSIESFAEMMNRYAAESGAKNTHFVNPHGLHDEAHYTTAYDLAIMTARALNNDEYRRIVGCKSYKIESEGHEARYIANKNKLLNMYDGAIGVKTGFTKIAGRCLVSAAERDGVTAVSVVLNEPDMWEKSINNLNAVFECCKRIRLGVSGEIIGNYHIGKKNKTVYYGLKEDADYISFGKNTEYSHEIKIDEKAAKNAKIGDCVGKISFYAQKRLIFERNLYTIDISE